MFRWVLLAIVEGCSGKPGVGPAHAVSLAPLCNVSAKAANRFDLFFLGLPDCQPATDAKQILSTQCFEINILWRQRFIILSE